MNLKLTASPSALPEIIEMALSAILLVTMGLFLDGFFIGEVSHTISHTLAHAASVAS